MSSLRMESLMFKNRATEDFTLWLSQAETSVEHMVIITGSSHDGDFA